MEPLQELLAAFADKLETIYKTISEFEEGMDYATHCSLQGFAEGLAYAMEEIKNRMDRETAQK